MTDVKNSNAAMRRRGRPPAFDRTTVLAKAAETFWRLGYEGASIADLTEAMGITAQSLYAAFGSKADLYQEALGWYRQTFATLPEEMLARPGVLKTVANWLDVQARQFADPGSPPGCMISSAVLGCAVENDRIAGMVAELRKAMMARLRRRLEKAKADGELRPEADPAVISRFVGAIVQGMSVQARDGANEAELRGIAALAAAEVIRHGVSCVTEPPKEP